jgi:hypothetical protein
VGRDFCHLLSIQTGSWADMQCVSGTLSPGVKRQGREADHSRPAIAEAEDDGAIPPLPYMP